MIDDPLFLFNEENHEYRYDKVKIPSVTRILQAAGVLDFSGVPPLRLEYKRQLGLAVDKACELYDMGCLDDNSVDQRIAEYVLAWIKFCGVEKFKPEQNQLMLFSKARKFAGRLDKMGVFRGKMAILDIKCTWSMYESTGPQLAAYELLVKENMGIKKLDRYGVLLKPSGCFDVYPFTDKMDESIFLSALQIQYWKDKNKGRKKHGYDDDGYTDE